MSHPIPPETIERFEREVLPHVDVAYRMAITLTHDPDRAADLVQEAILRALRAFPRLQHHDNLRSWLARVVHTTFLDMVRYEQRRPVESLDEHDDASDGAYGFVEMQPAVISESVDDDFEAALASLPPGWRSIVHLVDVEGMSYEETSIALDVPVGTVRSRLHRARHRLQIELCRRLELPGCEDAARHRIAGETP